MQSLYDFEDYRLYLKNWINDKNNKSKGGQSKLAAKAHISTTLISRILSAEKHLSLEQASEISDYLGHNESETEYFFILVQIGKSGSEKLTLKLKKQADQISKKVSRRIQNASSIDENIKSVYYSSWIYAGIRNLVATPGDHDVISISERLALPKHRVAKTVEFLLMNGLCVKGSNGLTYVSKKTHLDSESAFVNNHHINWRNKAVQIMDQKNNSDLFFTSPMSLSAETALEIRQMIPQLIETIMKKVEPSPSQKLYCLNMDWFEF